MEIKYLDRRTTYIMKKIEKSINEANADYKNNNKYKKEKLEYLRKEKFDCTIYRY